jgi:16S rRNA (cytosine1402-N4)-methyltransferase
VNRELDELKTFLDSIERMSDHLDGTKLAVISFHSLEDRLVKESFKKWARNCICSKDSIRCECGNNNALGKILTKKPITAGRNELARNPRSKSAKMRVFHFYKKK